MELVQHIVVTPSGSHEDVVTCVAIASMESLHHSRDHSDYAEDWNAWLAGSFTKTVRVASTKSQFDKVRDSGMSWVKTGAAAAVAFAPTAEPPEGTKRFRVTALNRERRRWFFWKPKPGSPIVAIDRRVNMTTGKTAAQAAHGLMAWYLQFGMPEDLCITDDLDTFMALDKTPHLDRIRIRDAGRTEVEPDTQTVIVGRL